ncbi:hypothetical protein [Brevundimonas sp. PAMC22021]|jgi:hypothetical protein|nr:hypothetical protein [Brevundimonas sp. PAMC22021]QYF87995.1 hypothetical protein KY493_05810 [Brevundimonas sp. PAMC22021]
MTKLPFTMPAPQRRSSDRYRDWLAFGLTFGGVFLMFMLAVEFAPLFLGS